MRIILCVDAIIPVLTGIGRYCVELVKGLKADQRMSSLRHWSGSQWVQDPLSLRDGPQAPAVRRGFLSKFHRAMDRRNFGSHLVHAPNYFLPDWAEGGIATVHDLSVFKYPETHPPERIADFEKRFDKTVHRADHFIVDCLQMKDELIAFTGVDPARVTAVYLGVAQDYRPRSQAESQEVLARHGLDYGDFTLCVSSLEPRKRIGELIAAYRELPRSLRDGRPLVLLGGAGWLNDDLHKQIEQAAHEGWLKPLGYVVERDLHVLYSGAGLFTYPSTYEGFGLPPIEAMASGVPVLAANSSCIPEVTAGAAMLVDPHDIDGFRVHLERALSDEAWRSQAVAAGRQVASGYSWERCVLETIAVYEHVLNERR